MSNVSSPAVVSGKTSVEARLAADGAMTLSINGQPAGAGKASGTLSRQPVEHFSFGFDDGLPVGDYVGDGHFIGTIEHLRVATGHAAK